MAMDDRAVFQELRALLFGEPPYERSGAPEPELLAELAPALDPSEREMAFRTLGNIGFMGRGQLLGKQRLRAFDRLITSISPADLDFSYLLGEGLLQIPT